MDFFKLVRGSGFLPVLRYFPFGLSVYTMPKVHVYDLKVQPIVDEAVLNADLLVTMQMRGEGKARLTLTGSRNYSVLEEKEEDYFL